MHTLEQDGLQTPQSPSWVHRWPTNPRSHLVSKVLMIATFALSLNLTTLGCDPLRATVGANLSQMSVASQQDLATVPVAASVLTTELFPHTIGVCFSCFSQQLSPGQPSRLPLLLPYPTAQGLTVAISKWSFWCDLESIPWAYPIFQLKNALQASLWLLKVGQ